MDNINNIENIIEIIHHNRDRTKLIQLNPVSINFNTQKILEFIIAQDILTSENETKILFNSIIQYIDINKINNKKYLYTIKKTVKSLKKILKYSVINNITVKWWLNHRGVTDEQIIKYNLIDMSVLRNFSEKHAIRLNAKIHPALQKWTYKEVGHLKYISEGVIIPVYDLNNNLLGCHNRLLSTVPKIKFCSSIPNYLLFTNLRINSKPKRIFLVEGVFDALAIDKICNKDDYFISPSSGFWSPEQFILLNNYLTYFDKAQIIPMFDNDRIGIKSNLIINSIYKDKTKLYLWPNNAKDPAEAINKYNYNFNDLKEIEFKKLLKIYKEMPYEKIINYDYYLNNRHCSYNNENYCWK